MQQHTLNILPSHASWAFVVYSIIFYIINYTNFNKSKISIFTLDNNIKHFQLVLLPTNILISENLNQITKQFYIGHFLFSGDRFHFTTVWKVCTAACRSCESETHDTEK